MRIFLFPIEAHWGSILIEAHWGSILIEAQWLFSLRLNAQWASPTFFIEAQCSVSLTDFFHWASMLTPHPLILYKFGTPGLDLFDNSALLVWYSNCLWFWRSKLNINAALQKFVSFQSRALCWPRVMVAQAVSSEENSHWASITHWASMGGCVFFLVGAILLKYLDDLYCGGH